MSESEEILRLRDRVHALTETVGILRMESRIHERKLNDLEQKVGEMAKADEIATAVAQALRRERANILTLPQKLGAVLVGVTAIASFVLQVYR